MRSTEKVPVICKLLFQNVDESKFRIQKILHEEHYTQSEHLLFTPEAKGVRSCQLSSSELQKMNKDFTYCCANDVHLSEKNS